MHDVAPVTGGEHRIVIFNPGSNRDQVSSLRLINEGADPATVTITGTDDEGRAPGDEVTVTVAPGSARTLTAQDLESGDGLEGALGDGRGKWALALRSDTPIHAMSLLASPTGHLTNLSARPARTMVVSGRALVGPLAGAEIEIEGLDGRSLGTTTTAAQGNAAGRFTVLVDRRDVPELVVVTAHGGQSLDGDNDGIRDDQPVPSQGRVRALVAKRRLSAPFTLNALGEIAYHELQGRYPEGLADVDPDTVLEALDEVAERYLSGGGTWEEILTFDPGAGEPATTVTREDIQRTVVEGIRAGASNADMASRVAALAAQLDNEGITTGQDGTIRRIEGEGAERVVTTITPDAARESVDAMEQVSVHPTGALVRARITKVTATQSRVDLEVSHRGNTLSIGGQTSLLQDVAFGEDEARDLVSRLVTVRARGEGELLIDLDKGVSRAISEGSLVFRVNGREPTADELDIVEDDPRISWHFTEYEEPIERLEYVDVPRWRDVKVKIVDGNLVVRMPTHLYATLAGLSPEKEGNRAEQLTDLVVNIGSATATASTHGAILSGFGKVVGAKVLAILLGGYSGVCTINFHLRSGFPLATERRISSSRVELMGFRQYHDTTLCAPIKGSLMREIDFDRDYPLVLWMWLKKGWLNKGKSRTVDLNVNAKVWLSHSSGKYDRTWVTEKLDSLRFGQVTLEPGYGYMIMPSQTIRFEGATDLRSAEVELWQDTALFDRNLTYPLRVGSIGRIEPKFNAWVLRDEVKLDATPSIFYEGETRYFWTIDDAGNRDPIILGEGPELREPLSTFENAANDLGQVHVTLTIEVGRFRRSTSRVIELGDRRPWNPEVAPEATNRLTHEGHDYEIVRGKLTWAAAAEAAAARTYRGIQGHLATVTSKREHDFLGVSLLTQDVRAAWIAGTNAGDPNAWRWAAGPEEGTQFWQGDEYGHAVGGEYANWLSGHPRAGSDICAYFVRRSIEVLLGQWASSPCHLTTNYIVEYSPQEAPAVLVKTSQTSAQPGGELTVSATVHNRGRTALGPATVRFYRSGDATISTGDTEVGAESAGHLSAGERKGLSVTTSAPSRPGTWYYGACVDGVSGGPNAGNHCSHGTAVEVGDTPVEPPPSGSLASYGKFHVIAHDLNENQDHDAECRSQLGNGFRLADWNDIVSYHEGGGSLTEFIARLKMAPPGKTPMPPDELGNGYRISRDGQPRSGGPFHYFVARHDHNRPSFFQAHAHIDNYHLSLGSWYGTGGYALCYEPGETGPRPVGEVFRDCAECPEMVVVPAGSFMMGSPDWEGGQYEYAGPVHRVRIAERFAVGVYEVTFDEWDACHRAGGCSNSPRDYGRGRGSRPVTSVNLHDAQEYVGWLSRKAGEGYRLLSESEWEYVARAGTTTRYWWGDEIGVNRANCDVCGSRWDGRQPAPVGSFPSNPFGLHDVHGNVEEWVADCWHFDYRGAPADGSAWTANCQTSLGRSMHVHRGGGWNDGPGRLRSDGRSRAVPHFNSSVRGFRVARTLTP